MLSSAPVFILVFLNSKMTSLHWLIETYLTRNERVA